MPRAFLLTAGLDWETLVNSSWPWLDEATQAIEGRSADDWVMRMLTAEDGRIHEFLERHGRSDQDKFVLAVALALPGTICAATEKPARN